ncbi:Abi family protein [Pseudomonas capsici]|uniref:Abi family protein n=1 Tax=Pseudomonas capsici TaxID=2810614 RepID=UPI0021F0EDCB|nr:Abi family protein [Pseudomonas capsici]MCV4342727.1 Abi family protein [Pseudomonas capsici]
MSSTLAQPVAPAIRLALSPARFATYEAAAVAAGLSCEDAVRLYAWNAHVSGSLLTPLHICEVAVRNAVSDALKLVYGDHWPWDKNFENSLPVSKGYGYQQRQDLIDTRNRFRTTDRIVVELKFVFWEKMFTSRHDQRIWNTHLFSLFPNLDPTKTVSAHRLRLATDLEAIRLLRNRIAHHEPIFRRNLIDEFSKVHGLVEARCLVSASWMMSEQRALAAIKAKPFST